MCKQNSLSNSTKIEHKMYSVQITQQKIECFKFITKNPVQTNFYKLIQFSSKNLFSDFLTIKNYLL